jgi:hypothetical protein
MSEINPFLNKKFIKDLKCSFIPQQIFKNKKYDFDIMDIDFKLKKNDIVLITVKLINGKKYEYAYILKTNNITENIISENDMIIDND